MLQDAPRMAHPLGNSVSAKASCFLYSASWPNATAQPLPKAEATQERTLEAVGCSRLILIEAPSPAYHRGMLIAGNYHSQRGGDLRRCSTTQHPLYCSIDRHARTIDGCLLPQDGESLVHRNMPAGPEPCLKAVAPSRSDLGVCVACLLPWDWRADLCARDGRPFGLGPAPSSP